VAVAGSRSSAGDPARTLELLWRDVAPTPRRGPARRLDVDAVVAAATELADQRGLEAVTMRAVAQAAGVAPMTLYTYVPGKAELLDLMLDAAYAAMPRTDTAGRPWRERATAIAEDNLALHLAHPWTVDVSTLRPPLGPGLIGKYDHELAAFERLDLTDLQMDDCLTYLLTFVHAAARSTLDAATARRESAVDDTGWWATAGPLLARALDPATYPLAARVGAAAGAARGSAHDPGNAYRFGLVRTLDGLAALIDRTPDRPRGG
jgi:AcrR family transcriptional regulator